MPRSPVPIYEHAIKFSTIICYAVSPTSHTDQIERTPGQFLGKN